MNILNKLFLMFAGVILISCASSNSSVQQNAATADFGPPPTSPEALVKGYFASTLVDPGSLTIQSISTPYKGYAFAPNFIPKGENYGYGIVAVINAKNRMGGYTGFKEYALFVRYDKVYHAFESFPPVSNAEMHIRPVGF